MSDTFEHKREALGEPLIVTSSHRPHHHTHTHTHRPAPLHHLLLPRPPPHTYTSPPTLTPPRRDSLLRKQRDKHAETYTHLPARGLPVDAVLAKLRTRSQVDVVVKAGLSRMSGTLYVPSEEHKGLLDKAYCLFSLTNPLHADCFPSVRRPASYGLCLSATASSCQLLPLHVSYCLFVSATASSCQMLPLHVCYSLFVYATTFFVSYCLCVSATASACQLPPLRIRGLAHGGLNSPPTLLPSPSSGPPLPAPPPQPSPPPHLHPAHPLILKPS